MKILALDASGLVASVALVEDETLIGEFTIDHKKTHSQTLLPMLDELKKAVELDLNSIDAIAVAAGPGSFTGLRISSATAKGLGLALNKPIISIPTVEGLAYGLWGAQGYVCPIMDARRNQTYTGIYEFDQDGKMVTVLDQCAVGIDEIVEILNQKGQAVTFLGDGVPVFTKYIQENCKIPYRFAPAHCNKQHAASVAARALTYAAEGKMEAAGDHRPIYLRQSQAERERSEKLAAEGKVYVAPKATEATEVGIGRKD